MKLLIDYHHPTLWESYNLTFVDRLGWEIYRPIGMEWYQKGYWRHEHFWNQDGHAKIFLPHREGDIQHNGWSSRLDDSNVGRSFKMVTVDQAYDIGFDWVISSVPGNQLGFAQFAGRVGARAGVQIGNNEHSLLWDIADAVLDSTATHRAPVGHESKHLVYDQEIDGNLYREWPTTDESIASLLLVWHNDDAGLAFFRRVQELLPVGRLTLYGQSGTELHTNLQVSAAMREHGIIWHTKKIGDGWGHTLHTAFSLGRPVIGVNAYYNGMKGQRLLQDNPGVLDIGGMTPEAVAKEIVRRDHEGLWVPMGQQNRKRFEEVIDYEGDAKRIQELLTR